MAQKPHEYDRDPPKGKKKPSKYASSIVGQSGEFVFPEGYGDLDGIEMIVRQALPGGYYLVSVAGSGGRWKRGEEFIVGRAEFVTNYEKKRQAGMSIEVQIAEIVVSYVRAHRETCEKEIALNMVYEALGHKLTAQEVAWFDETWSAEND